MGDDTISRQAAIDAHYEYCNKHPDAGFPVWSLKILEDLPPAQPEKHTEKHTETHACDCISRQAAIEAIFNEPLCESGMKERTAIAVVLAIYEKINSLPSAQPETCDTCKHGYFGDTQCDNCCVRYPSHYERRIDE